MNHESVYRNVALLLAGMVSIVVLGGVALISSLPEPNRTLSSVDPYDALRLLMASEFAHLASELPLDANAGIAIGSELSGDAVEVLERFGRPWIREQSWESNRGGPPAGTVLVQELRIEEDAGFVTVLIGEIANLEACGTTVKTRYTWLDGWTDRNVTLTMC